MLGVIYSHGDSDVPKYFVKKIKTLGKLTGIDGSLYIWKQLRSYSNSVDSKLDVQFLI